MKYADDEPFVKKHEHSLPLSVCAAISVGRYKILVEIKPSLEGGNIFWRGVICFGG